MVKLHTCQFGPVKMPWGPRRGNSLKCTPSPLFATKKIVLDKTNAFEGSKMMLEEVFFLSVPFRSKHFDAFLGDIFVVLGKCVHILHIMDTTNLIG